MQVLRADTETIVTIGPFPDVGDGFTPQTDITLGGDEAELLKHGSATVVDISGATWAAVANCRGYYSLTLTAAHVDTEGRLTVVVQDDSDCLPVRGDFMVMNAPAFDALYAAAGTDYLPVDLLQMGGVTQSGTDLKDFADAGYDPATNKVQGVVLVDTTTTNTDLISAATMADAVWDEVLTGGTHNIPTSAGRRLRNIQDFGIYDLARVWVDEVAGASTGTTDGEDATVTNRADDLDNALTVAASVGLDEVSIQAGNSITLTGALAGYKVYAYEATIALGGQSLAGTRIYGATVSGTFTGNPVFVDCIVNGTITGPGATLINCRPLAAVIENNGTDHWLIHNSRGETAGASASLTFDFNSTANADCSLRNVSHGITIEGMVATNEMSIEGFGSITEGTCTAGSPEIRGVFKLNAFTNLTPNIVAAMNTATVADASWDETLADHLGVGSTGNALNAAGAAGDPWSTAIPGAYGAGTAGKIVGDNVNAPIATVDTVVDGIAAEVGTAGDGLTAINLPNQTMDIVGSITGNLSGSVGSVTGAVGSVTGAVGSVTAEVTADAVKISGSSDAADKLEASAETMLIGTVSHDNSAATTTVFYCDDITEATADHFNGRLAIFTSGALLRQATDITGYELSAGEGKFTVTALTEAPADNVSLIIV